jgi:TorA maturation chaperone TorD
MEALILAHLWSRPNAAEVKDWHRLAHDWPDAVRHLLGAGGAAMISGAKPDALAAEYDRRIRGAGAWPASPYESLWREDIPPSQRHGLWPPAVTSLKRIYAKLPSPPPPDLDVDEVSVELHALASAFSQESSRECARDMLEDHLTHWLPGFCESVVRTTTLTHYRLLATATLRWLAAARSALAMSAGVD